MKIQKKYLEVLYKTIKGTEGVLTLAEGRIRDNFMKPLFDATEQFENDRKKIFEQYCVKEEDGTPKIIDSNYHFSKDEAEIVNKEVTTLIEEDVELPEEPRIKEIIERTQYKPLMGESEMIDTIITKF